MANEPDVNFQEALGLLTLIREQAQVAPKLTHISAYAHSRLLDMDHACQEWADEVARELAEAKAERDAAEAERVAEEQAMADEVNAASAGRTAQAKAIPASDFAGDPALGPVVTTPAASVVRRT